MRSATFRFDELAEEKNFNTVNNYQLARCRRNRRKRLFQSYTKNMYRMFIGPDRRAQPNAATLEPKILEGKIHKASCS